MTPIEQHNFEQSLTRVESALPSVVRALHIYYKALVEQGFTEGQAMYLVGVHGTSFGVKEIGK